MKGIRYTVEQIIAKLREVEIHVSQGKTFLMWQGKSGSAKQPIISGERSMRI